MLLPLPLLAVAQIALADPADAATPAEAVTQDAPAEPWQRTGVGWGGFPFANYSSDDGLGFGALGSIFFYDGETKPYRSELYFLLYFSTQGVQTHRVQYDWLKVGGSKLRLTTRAEFSADRTSNYCGQTPPGDCDPAEAIAQAEAAGLTDDPGNDDDAYDQFVRRYYLLREIRPNLYALGRWALVEDPIRYEVFGSWYGELKRVGDLEERAPWPGSLYAQDFGPDGEEGFVSLLQLGLMADSRDNEPAPIRGQWSEISLRAAGPWTGSTFDYGGVNLTLRGYVPLGTDRVVLTDRLVLDGMWGAPPTSEQVRSGGTDFYWWFGGQRAGRGVRSRRVLGKARSMNQVELRATAAILHPGKATIDITPIAFADLGLWAIDFQSLDQAAFLVGTGGGLRLAINKNFILRGDVGVSPLEDWGPQVYLDVKNLW